MKNAYNWANSIKPFIGEFAKEADSDAFLRQVHEQFELAFKGSNEAEDARLSGEYSFLKNDLERIKGFDRKQYERFVKSLKKEKDENNFYGLRAEIRMMSHLINSELEFAKSETPDFLVSHINDTVGVESTLFSKQAPEKEVVFLETLKDIVMLKDKKSYSAAPVCLVVECSNLLHFLGEPVKNDRKIVPKIYEEFRKWLSKQKFKNVGAVVLRVFTIAVKDKDTGLEIGGKRISSPVFTVECGYKRFDLNKSNNSFLAVCNSLFPMGQHKVDYWKSFRK